MLSLKPENVPKVSPFMNQKTLTCSQSSQMSHLNFILLGIFVFLSSPKILCYNNSDEGSSSMEEDELFGLFEVMGSLLEDPSWAQTYPQPCTETPWPGIECELQVLEKDSIFHVTRIHISPDIINPPCKNSATISESFNKLHFLKSLSLINCFTSSSVSLPNSLFANWSSSLEHLSLVSNPSLIGDIPSSLSNLETLKILSFSQNSLTGKIPGEIGNLVNLQQLDLSHNNLTGPVPEEIGNLHNLAILDLSGNILQEIVPVSVSNLQSIEKIDLSWNKLQGNLPQEMGNLKRLVLLDLSHNYFKGPIPESFSGLDDLQYLIMEGNMINSLIPSFIRSLTNLRVLSFSGCGLTGPLIGSNFANLTKLTSLALDSNSLSGPIPQELGALLELDMLNLSRNLLSGEVLFSQDFVDKLGMRLDLKGNNGLCTNLPNAETDRASLQIPTCSSSGLPGGSNKTVEDNRPEHIKPILFKGDLSSNGGAKLVPCGLVFMLLLVAL